MPYIPEIEREKYNERIDSIGCTLNSLEDNDKISGELNYLFFRLASFLCSTKVGGTHNYARMAVVSSAFSEAQAEFRRRILAPYEDEKIKINGDVKSYPCNAFGDLQSPYEPKRLTKSDRERFGR